MTVALIGVILLCAWALRTAEKRRRELREEVAEIREQAKEYF